MADEFDRTSVGSAVGGWDIGGANIKAARLDRGGLRVVQRPFAIWQRRDDLAATVAELAAELGPAPHASVTMTAELSDAFRTKREGVTFVLDAMRAALPAARLTVFGVDGQFHDFAAGYADPLLVAAANWMATAQLVARDYSTCVLVDIGSTTADIIPIRGGQVLAHGRNDTERLVHGELLYTGALRTPVCAIVQRVPLWGRWCPVAAELFATAQDVHLILGSLTPEQCQSPTADGRPAGQPFAAERLARIVCADSELLSGEAIHNIARYIANEQVRQIARAIAQALSAGAGGRLVAAGAGVFLAEAAAAQLGLDCVTLAAKLGASASCAAPAAALALLLDEQLRV